MQKVLQEVKKLTNSQKIKLYNSLQKDIYAAEKTAEKELTPGQWRVISTRLKDMESGKTKGISLAQHLQWLKKRRNAL